MEPNNIEKQIREKLSQREIQPSAQAWDRLDAMLSVAEEKKTRRSFGWLYIAAGILVFATLGMFFYNQQDVKGHSSDGLVNRDIPQNSSTLPSKAIEHQTTIAVPATTTEVAAQMSENKERSTVNKAAPSHSNPKSHSNIIRQKTNAVTVTKSEAIAVNVPKNQQPQKSEPAQPSVSPKTIAPHEEEAVVSNEKAPSSAKVKIDANSLLSEVDGELELTFREKVLKKVTKNYKEVKVALANRNLQ